MKRLVKIAASLVAVSAIAVAIGWVTGFVKFTSVTFVSNEPLRYPCRVKEMDATNLVLEGGQVIRLDRAYAGSARLSNLLTQSDFQLDIERGDTNRPGAFETEAGNTHRLDLYVRRPRRSDSVRPLVFTIPLIRKSAGTDNRVWMASGRYVITNNQDRGGDGIQPIQSGTNTSPAEAGSKR